MAAGLPVVLSMRESLFFPAWQFSLGIPGLPIPLRWNDITILALLFALLVARSRHSRYVPVGTGSWIWASVVAYGLLLLFHVPLSWYVDVTFKPGVVFVVRRFLYLPVGAFLWMDLLRRASRRDTIRLLQSVVVVTVVMSLLYSVSAAGVSIYPSVPYQTLAFGQGEIIRDFVTIPAWISVSLAFLVVERRLGSVFFLFPIMAAYFFSYTRTLIFAMISVFLAGAFLPMFRREEGGGFYKVLLSILFSMFILFVVVNSFFSANLRFLGQRMSEVQEMGMGTTNLAARIETARMLSRRLTGEQALFGEGLSPEGESRSELPTVLEDSLWNRILYQFGWTGVISFAAILLSTLVVTFRRALRETGGHGLGLVLFLSTLHMLMVAFSSSSILSDTPFIAAFVVALAVVETRDLWPREGSAPAGTPA